MNSSLNRLIRVLKLFAGAAVALLLGLAGTAQSASYSPTIPQPPKPARELRGVWVATVSNIDWPSTNNLTPAQQRAELVQFLDRAKDLKLNTVIFQVRPGCDALYESKLEPWSEYLTGAMGKAPEPRYDPLAFAVKEAHRRGLELHAWFNPFRARHARARSPISADHISRTKPSLVRQYGNSLWLDPGDPRVQEHSLAVILDVVRRYDIDGVHIDDYFYPYKEKDSSGRELDFPDESTWKRFGSGTALSRDDWRRENVNTFVRRLYEATGAEKRWVKVGISPFGIWRPGFPSQIRGLDAYEKLYADSRKWLNKGWMDYLAPQLYWAIDVPEQSFPVLLKWWAQQNERGRVLTPGMDSTKTLGRWPSSEIVNQIRLTRQQSGTSGHIHWNMRALMRNAALVQELKNTVYTAAALAPEVSRNGGAPPGKPVLSAQARPNQVQFNWNPPAGQPLPRFWLVQTKQQEWKTTILSGDATSMRFSSAPPSIFVVSAVDRMGQIGSAAAMEQKQ